MDLQCLVENVDRERDGQENKKWWKQKEVRDREREKERAERKRGEAEMDRVIKRKIWTRKTTELRNGPRQNEK